MRTLLLALLAVAPLTLAQAAPAPVVAPEAPSASVDYTEAWRALLTERRATAVRRLHRYAKAGVFPRNDFQPGYASMLLDQDGNPCAMASLVIHAGHRDLIEALAGTDNAVQFGAVTEGPLYDWILTSGLTQEETAFVQEPDFFVEQDLPDERQLLAAEQDRLRAHFAAAADLIDADTTRSVEVALARLGDQIHEPPPAE